MARILGGLLVLALAAACAVLEVFYLPLRVGSVLLPVSVLAAVIGNLAFTRLMYVVSGSILAALLPTGAWLAVIGRAAISRPEGDLLITDGGASATSAVVNLAFFVLGAVAGAYAVGTLRRQPVPSQGPPAALGPSQGTPAMLGTYQSSPVGVPADGQPPETAGNR